MYQILIRYLCSAFVEADNFESTPSNIALVQDALKDKSLSSITVLEVQGPGEPPRPRILLRDQAKGFQVILGSKRFDVSVAGKPSDPIPTFESVCGRSATILSRILRATKRHATRLAAVQEGFLPERSPKQMSDLARKMLNLRGIYKINPPFEWDWRAATRISRDFGKKHEDILTIVTLKRIAGVMHTPETAENFDRIRLDFDLNTSFENTTPRFGSADTAAFFKAAPGWHADLSSEILPLIQAEKQ